MEVESLTIKNSPIEFLLVGPQKGRDKVIVQSAGAGLDLLGLAIENQKESAMFSASPSIIGLIAGTQRQLNVIESYQVNDLSPNFDSRQSTMRFAWVGHCSPIRQERIRDSFNRSLSDLQKAIHTSNLADVEWAIAPVIFNCAIGNERRLRSRRVLYTTLVIYAITGLVMLSYLFARNLLRF
jgi:hypothetical protein